MSDNDNVITSVTAAILGKVEGAARDQERYELELPSGSKAQILRRGKGRHIELAARMLGQQPTQMQLSMAMVAVKAQVDGRALTFEDVQELEDFDVFALIGAVMGKAPVSPDVT